MASSASACSANTTGRQGLTVVVAAVFTALTVVSRLFLTLNGGYNGCHCHCLCLLPLTDLCGFILLNMKHVSKYEGEVETLEDGRRLIQSRLCCKNVLVVLDEVAYLDQLKALVGSHDWFGRGSRIIITTRDEQLLVAHRVDVMYNTDILNEWVTLMKRSKSTVDQETVQQLYISYDGLTRVEKSLFLDVACFFRQIDKDLAMEILKACDFHAAAGIKVLMQKALITVDNYGRIDMYDLVQEMGHYIVRREHPNSPEKHTRVWKWEEVTKISDTLAERANYTIEALRCRPEKVNLILPRDYDIPNSLPMAISNVKKLRWIDWTFCPVSLLPTTFPPVEICYIKLEYSMVEKLWEGYKYLPSLKVINLSHSNNLIKTPDLSGLLYLEKMSLVHCWRLKEIHPSTGCHKELVHLDMNGCCDIESFPPIIGMQKLETLDFSDCWQLKLPEMQMNMASLKRLYLCGNAIEVVPSSIGERCLNLQTLDLSKNKFSRIGSSLSRLTHLKSLNLSSSSELVELPDLPSSLAILKASCCDSLEIIGDFPTNCKWLWNVSLWKTRKIGMTGVEKVVQSMLEGDAVEDYIVSIDVGIFQVEAWLYQTEVFSLGLPPNWDNDFTGFFICSADSKNDAVVEIEMLKDYESHLPVVDQTGKIGKMGRMWYISFNSLRHTSWWDWHLMERSRQILFYIRGCRFKVELFPGRKAKGGSVERPKPTTDYSEYWDHERTFGIKHDSKSSLKIEWRHL